MGTAKFQKLIARLTNRKTTAPGHQYKWRTRQKKLRVPKTKEQKNAEAARRAKNRLDYLEALTKARGAVEDQAQALRDQFGAHTLEYYKQAILRYKPGLIPTRKTSNWNAFISREVTQMNDGLPKGAKRNKSAQLMSQVRARYKELQKKFTKDEIGSQLAEHIAHLGETRNMRAQAVQNVPIKAYQDTRSTLASIESRLADLKVRTGTETILITVRSGGEQYNAPSFYSTSPKGREFFSMALNVPSVDVAPRFEAFILSGVKGAAEHYIESLVKLKCDASKLIHERLNACVGFKVPRMAYTNFDTHITSKYGVVVENWPLKLFVSPGDLTLTNDLKVLLQSWTSGSTRFRKLTDDEKAEWEEARFQAAPKVGEVVEGSNSANDTTSGEVSWSSTQSTEVSSTQSTSRPPPADMTSAVVTGIGGIGSVKIVKKARKERSDKGVKRGPRVKKA